MDDYGGLIDTIYEAALVPDLWPRVLDEIADMAAMKGGILFAVTPEAAPNGATAAADRRWTSSPALADLFMKFVTDGWADRNLRVTRGLHLNHAGFVTDADLFTPDEIANEPLYHYFRQNGLGWCTGFASHVPSGDTLIFSWERRHDDGPVSPETVALLDPLRPHLARAALMASRLGFARARATAETLATLGLPAAILSPLHSVMALNPLMEALMPVVVEDRAKGRLHLADRQADQLLARALAQTAKTAETRETADRPAAAAVFSMPIPARDGQPAMVLHLIPVRRSARDIFATAATIVILTPVCRSDVPAASVIQGLFDLTAAETRVARLIVGGGTVNEIATASRTTEGTVRNQLKAVFAKTGVARQGDLISLLSNIDPTRKPLPLSQS